MDGSHPRRAWLVIIVALSVHTVTRGKQHRSQVLLLPPLVAANFFFFFAIYGMVRKSAMSYIPISV